MRGAPTPPYRTIKDQQRRPDRLALPSSAPPSCFVHSHLVPFQLVVTLFGGFLFVGPGAAKDTKHAVISLMTSVLEKGISGLGHHDFYRPGFGVHGRIVDRGLVGEGVRRGARETVGYPQILVG